MKRAKKIAPGANRGAEQITKAGSQLSTPHYIPNFTNCKPISGLLDLSLDKIDYHMMQAAALRRRAIWHDQQAARHRAIKREIESLIYPQVNRGSS